MTHTIDRGSSGSHPIAVATRKAKEQAERLKQPEEVRKPLVVKKKSKPRLKKKL